MAAVASPLIAAVDDLLQGQGSLQDVEKLLQDRADPNQCLLKKPSPLASAAQAQHKGLVQLLLRQGADANQRDRKGVGALHLAAFDGSGDCVQALLEGRADANIADKHGQTPLFFASTAQVCDLLLAGRADVNVRNRKMQSAMHFAAHAGFDEIVKKFAELPDKELLDVMDQSGRTPFYYAARAGVKKTVGVLQDNGASMTLHLPPDAHSAEQQGEVLRQVVCETQWQNINFAEGGAAPAHLSLPQVLQTELATQFGLDISAVAVEHRKGTNTMQATLTPPAGESAGSLLTRVRSDPSLGQRLAASAATIPGLSQASPHICQLRTFTADPVKAARLIEPWGACRPVSPPPGADALRAAAAGVEMMREAMLQAEPLPPPPPPPPPPPQPEEVPVQGQDSPQPTGSEQPEMQEKAEDETAKVADKPTKLAEVQSKRPVVPALVLPTAGTPIGDSVDVAVELKATSPELKPATAADKPPSLKATKPDAEVQSSVKPAEVRLPRLDVKDVKDVKDVDADLPKTSASVALPAPAPAPVVEERKQPEIKLPKLDVQMAQATTPKLETDPASVKSTVGVPTVTVSAKTQEPEVELPTAEVSKKPSLEIPVPAVGLQTIKADAPGISLESKGSDIPAPAVDLPTVTEEPKAARAAEVRVPTVDVPPVKVESKRAEIEIQVPKVDVPPITVEPNRAEMEIQAPAVDVSPVKVEPKKAEIEIQAPAVDVSPVKVEPKKAEIEIQAPVVDVSPVKVEPEKAEIEMPAPALDVPPPVKVEPEKSAIEVQAPTLDVPTVAAEHTASGMSEMQVPTVEVPTVKEEPKAAEVRMPTVELPTVAVEPETAEMQVPAVEVPTVTVEPKSTEMQVPAAEVPAVTVEPKTAEMQVPAVEVPTVTVEPQSTEMQVQVPAVTVEAEKPKATEMQVPAVTVEPKASEMQVPTVEVSTVAVEPKTTEIRVPTVDVPTVTVEPESTEAQVPTVEVPTVRVGSKASEMDVPPVNVPPVTVEPKEMSEVPVPTVEAPTPTVAAELKSTEMQTPTVEAPAVTAELKNTEMQMPTVEAPAVTAELKNTEMQTPTVEAPTVAAELKNTEMQMPTVEAPTVSVEPKVSEMHVPTVDVPPITLESTVGARSATVEPKMSEMQMQVPAAPMVEVPTVTVEPKVSEMRVPTVDAPSVTVEHNEAEVRMPTVDVDVVDVPPVTAESKAPGTQVSSVDAPAVKMEPKLEIQVPVVEPREPKEPKESEIRTPVVDVPAVQAGCAKSEVAVPSVDAPEPELPEMQVPVVEVQAPAATLGSSKPVQPVTQVEVPTAEVDVDAPRHVLTVEPAQKTTEKELQAQTPTAIVPNLGPEALQPSEQEAVLSTTGALSNTGAMQLTALSISMLEHAPPLEPGSPREMSTPTSRTNSTSIFNPLGSLENASQPSGSAGGMRPRQVAPMDELEPVLSAPVLKVEGRNVAEAEASKPPVQESTPPVQGQDQGAAPNPGKPSFGQRFMRFFRRSSCRREKPSESNNKASTAEPATQDTKDTNAGNDPHEAKRETPADTTVTVTPPLSEDFGSWHSPPLPALQEEGRGSVVSPGRPSSTEEEEAGGGNSVSPGQPSNAAAAAAAAAEEEEAEVQTLPPPADTDVQQGSETAGDSAQGQPEAAAETETRAMGREVEEGSWQSQEVTLERSSQADKYGFAYSCSSSSAPPGLPTPPEELVIEVIGAGKLRDWNQDHPQSEVLVQDRIYSINGTTSCKQMQEALTSSKACMQLRRYPQEFRIQLKREAEPFGFGFVPTGDGCLRITDVAPHGSLHAHNKREAKQGRWDHVVLPGSRVTMVNSIAGEPARMAKELLTGKEASLLVQRAPAEENQAAASSSTAAPASSSTAVASPGPAPAHKDTLLTPKVESPQRSPEASPRTSTLAPPAAQAQKPQKRGLGSKRRTQLSHSTPSGSSAGSAERRRPAVPDSSKATPALTASRVGRAPLAIQNMLKSGSGLLSKGSGKTETQPTSWSSSVGPSVPAKAEAVLQQKEERNGCLCWDVLLEKHQPGDEYGFASVDGRLEVEKRSKGELAGPETLVVWRVREGGLLAGWNAAHPELAVLPHDRICSVNGELTIEGMQHEVRSQRVVMRVVRYPERFAARLVRESRLLGCRFERLDEAGEMRILDVAPTGALHHYNLQQAERGLWQFVVLPGMIIESANGASGTVQELLEALKKTDEVALVIRRSHASNTPADATSSDLPEGHWRRSPEEGMDEQQKIGEDGPGHYVLTADAIVAPKLVTCAVKDAIGELQAGTQVKVLEVSALGNVSRVRGRLESPAGWISLLNTETGFRWAERTGTPAASRLVELPGVVPKS